MTHKKKLIEVALPLEAINKASAREKSIHHGHPGTLHLWWARRPLAAARAVIFAQMVDDPSTYVDVLRADPKLHRKAETALKGRLKLWEEARSLAKKAKGSGLAVPEPGPVPTLDEMLADQERQRLFRIIEDLVLWENTTNETVLQAARDEIWNSWRRACAENADHPRAKELFDRKKLPAFHDPFSGGGALPLEAQRLGLESYASDLNPVAVLINKAMIEIPPKYAGKPPVNPEGQIQKDQMDRSWHGAQGLAEDVRAYGQWMRDEAEKRIGHLYPKVEVTAAMAKERPDLKKYEGRKLTVIAWLWARTVKSPNPAFAQVDVPLASTFMLSTKVGKEAYVEPVIGDGGYRFTVKVGKPKDAAKNGTKLARANFSCLMSGTPISGDYIKAEGKAGRMGARLMAIVAEGERGRVYLAPTPEHEAAAHEAKPTWRPEGEIATRMTGGNCTPYGLTSWGDLFTSRQLVALTTFSDLVQEARERVRYDALAAGLADDAKPLRDGGIGATAYADAVGVYLALAVDKVADRNSTLCAWASLREHARNTFGRQALPMVWDFAESNPLSDSSGNFEGGIVSIVAGLGSLDPVAAGHADQVDAQSQEVASAKVVSTDPPYYDNIGYADLSDFFYVWLRCSLKTVFPDLFATLVVPKAEELVATPYRHGGKEKAKTFFLDGMTQAMRRLAKQTHTAFPITIYYAFKQAEIDDADGTTNTGWDTFLAAVIEAGFAVSGTWPMRTELDRRMIGSGTNALASSIVLVCRKRAVAAPTATRREFVTALKAELPAALAQLQRGNIAPVDLAQAAIGPGMAVYTRYAKVLDAEGKALTVREALTLINQTLDEALAEQEGDFDADSRWALTWFEQSGFAEGEYGVAEQLSKSKNTSVAGMAEAGILESKRGKVRLLRPGELPANWDPATDLRLTAWELVHHLIRVLASGGEGAAAELVVKLGAKAEIARELAYRLYSLCERKKRTPEALAYNGLVQSWPEIVRLSRESGKPRAEQGALFEETEE
jgi:putative DNA methylase